MKNFLLHHLKYSLMNCEVFSQPFKVCYFNPFPQDFYLKVLKNLPDDSDYVDLDHQDARPGSRKALLLTDTVSIFWRWLSAVFCSKEVEDLFRKSLGFEGHAIAAARLLRDFDGYRINPHQDSSKKLCTVQFYLPKNNEQSALGTSFYSKHAESFKEEFRLKFLPNSGYCFKVADDSWHGCDFKSVKAPRDTLILTYYKAK